MKKRQKGQLPNIQHNQQKLAFGSFGIKSFSSWRIPAKTIEAIRRVITRQLKRQGKLFIRIYPDTPITKKPAEVRMGKGKGSIHSWVAKIAKGQILFEMDGVSLQLAHEAFLQVSHKLPFHIRFIDR